MEHHRPTFRGQGSRTPGGRVEASVEPMPGFRHPEDNSPQACQPSLTSEPCGSLSVIIHRGWVGYHIALILFQHLLFLAAPCKNIFPDQGL